MPETLTGERQYAFPSPTLDTGINPCVQNPGTFSRLVGVDGRYTGQLRRFPGFRRYKEFTTFDEVEAIGGLRFFKSFSIQKSPGDTAIFRGWIILSKTATTSVLRAVYYDTGAATWTETTIYDFGSTSVLFIDVTMDHTSLYMVAKVSSGSPTTLLKMIRFEGSSWVSHDFLPPAAVGTTAAPTSTQDTTNGLIEGPSGGEHRVGVAWRETYPEQGIYSRLSPIQSVQQPSTSGNWYVSAAFTLTAKSANFTKRYLELYRTVSSAFEGSGQTGNLYRERIIDTTAVTTTTTYEWAKKDASGLSDPALAIKEVLPPAEVRIVTTLTDAKLIEWYEKCMFIASGASTSDTLGQDDRSLEVLRWSSLVDAKLNIFPVEQKRRANDLNQRIVELKNVEPYLAVIYTNQIVVVHKSGASMSTRTINNIFGTNSSNGVVAVDTSLFLPTKMGVLLVDLATNSSQLIRNTQRIFDTPSRWRGSLDKVWGVHDADLSAVIWLNPSTYEMLILWLGSGDFTELEHVPWIAATQGTLPVEGTTESIQRSFYLFDGGQWNINPGVYVVDTELSSEVRSMSGGVSIISGNRVAWNGTVFGGSTSAINVSPDVGADLMTGHWLYWTSGANAGTWILIDEAHDGNPVINFQGTTPNPPQAGDTFSIAPIAFRAKMWPTKVIEGRVHPSLFGVDKFVGVQALVQEVSGDTDSTKNPNLKLTYRAYKSANPEVVAASGEGTFSTNPSDTGAALNVSGHTLIPEVAQYASNLQFGLLGLRIFGSSQESVVGKARS